jgi:aminopeptidase 2
MNGSIDINRPVNAITLHAAKPLQVTHATLSSHALKTESVQNATAIEIDEKGERAVLKFGAELPAGSKARLSLWFSAPLEASMMGYYKSSYTKGNGEKSHYSLTQVCRLALALLPPGLTERGSTVRVYVGPPSVPLL